MRGRSTAVAETGVEREPSRLELLASLNSLQRGALEYAEELASSAARQIFAEALPEGVLVVDRDGRVQCWNRRFVTLYDLGEAALNPGEKLSTWVERAFGAGPTPIDPMLSHCEDVSDPRKRKSWIAQLPDGRRLSIQRQATADGGWVSTHDDVTDLFANQSLADVGKSVQALIDLTPDCLWAKDAESRFVFANDATARVIGMPSGPSLVGKHDFEIHPMELAAKFAADERRILQTGESLIDYEEYVLAPDGRKMWLATTKVPLRDEEGAIVGLLGISRDIAQRKLTEELRDGQAAVLEMIALNAPLAEILDKLARLIESQLTRLRASILLLDEDGRRLRHGAAPSLPGEYVGAIDGVEIGPGVGSCGTAVHRREQVIVEDIETDPLWADFRGLAASIEARACWSMPIFGQDARPLGAFALYATTPRRPIEAEARLIEFAAHIAGIAIERKRAEDRIRFMAEHDALTRLPNRTTLNKRLCETLARARAFGCGATVAFIDLDGFKDINDSLGHRAGDAVLVAVAERVGTQIGPQDTFARIGGDEFVVVLGDQSGGASPRLQAIHAAISAPIPYAGHELRVSCSIGVANFPGDGETADDLLAEADAAMYRAKEAGRDTIRQYTPEMKLGVQEKFNMREALRGALERGQLALVYQPQVDVAARRIVGAEALIRWSHPELGRVPPARFIPLAEETGLIGPIGEWVIKEACRQNKAWQDLGLRPIRVSVNVSARQFGDGSLTAVVAAALEASGLAAHYLELELTESLIMRNLDHALKTMSELRSLGVWLAIDDFGTGYSSLSALKTFPVARLKIDKCFVDGLPANRDDAAVASVVVALGQKLGMEVIAEGVETAEQVASLLAMACGVVQGYHFSRPIPASEFEALFRKGLDG